MYKTDPEYLIPLSATDYQILTALTERPLYGFALIDQCRDDSEGIIVFTGGTVYPPLKRLEQLGYITRGALQASKGSKPRQTYSISARGRTVFEQETSRLKRAVYLAEHRLNQKSPEQQAPKMS